jgi:hypothetical protein
MLPALQLVDTPFPVLLSSLRSPLSIMCTITTQPFPIPPVIDSTSSVRDSSRHPTHPSLSYRHFFHPASTPSFHLSPSSLDNESNGFNIPSLFSPKPFNKAFTPYYHLSYLLDSYLFSSRTCFSHFTCSLKDRWMNAKHYLLLMIRFLLSKIGQVRSSLFIVDLPSAPLFERFERIGSLLLDIEYHVLCKDYTITQ